MDSLTRDVFRCLQWSPEAKGPGLRPTYWSMAKRLGVSPKAVKLRLNYLHDKGVVSRLRVIPDVSLFGMERRTVSTTMGARVVKRMKEKINLFDFVESAQVSRTYRLPEEAVRNDHRPVDSHFVRFDLVLERGSRREDSTRLLSILHEVFGRFTVISDSAPGPRGHHSHRSDARLVRVLRELVRSPFAELREMSEKASVSEGTARKYLRVLARTRAFRFEPVVDLAKTDSMSFFVRVAVDTSRRRRVLEKLKERLADDWLLEDIGREEVAGLVCVAENLSRAEAIYASATEDAEFSDAPMLLGLQTVDNQANVSYMRARKER